MLSFVILFSQQVRENEAVAKKKSKKDGECYKRDIDRERK
jgi:hypothetical protein